MRGDRTANWCGACHNIGPLCSFSFSPMSQYWKRTSTHWCIHFHYVFTIHDLIPLIGEFISAICYGFEHMFSLVPANVCIRGPCCTKLSLFEGSKWWQLLVRIWVSQLECQLISLRASIGMHLTTMQSWVLMQILDIPNIMRRFDKKCIWSCHVLRSLHDTSVPFLPWWAYPPSLPRSPREFWLTSGVDKRRGGGRRPRWKKFDIPDLWVFGAMLEKTPV